jgi:hypothetical protein
MYTFVLLVGASLGPMVAVAVRPQGFATLCVVLAAVFAAAAALGTGARPARRPDPIP